MPRRNDKSRPAPIPRSMALTVFARKLSFFQELSYSSWTDLGNVHLRSLNVGLSFRPVDLPGWSSISQNWDQYRISKVHYLFVNSSTLGQVGINNAGRIVTLMTSYDPDGGSESAVDILSRNNVNFDVMGFASNEWVRKSCVPGHLSSTGEILRNVWLDQNKASVYFNSFQTVVDTLSAGITPSDTLRLGTYVTVDLEFRGAR